MLLACMVTHTHSKPTYVHKYMCSPCMDIVYLTYSDNLECSCHYVGTLLH